MADDPPIVLRPEVISKLKSALSESFYREAIENSSTYNNRLVIERKTRLPFIDAQTGVAQNDCFLWMQKWERMPGMTDGQLYSYPVRRWKKKRRQYLLNHSYQNSAIGKFEQSVSNNGDQTNGSATAFELNGTNGLESTSVAQSIDEHNETKFFVEREQRNENSNWSTEFEDASDIPDAAEIDDDSDFDDFEDYGSRKKRRKKNEGASTPGRRRKVPTEANNDKPFQCDLCKMRYKTRPGLTYHYTHIHANENLVDRRPPLDEEDSQTSQMGTSANGKTNSSTSNSPLPPSIMHNSNINNSNTNSNSSTNSMSSNANARLNSSAHAASPIPPSLAASSSSKNGEESKEGVKPRKSNPPSSYCDFCLGNSEINKKTKSQEEMISCSDCGRSAHPTCLQFTANMILSVKKYRWQCIECKSCGLCGTSDNDDQLLFCDDCDRGYHMYCLKPPLQEPPEGSWSCHLCIEEYHRPKSDNPPSTDFAGNKKSTNSNMKNNSHSSSHQQQHQHSQPQRHPSHPHPQQMHSNTSISHHLTQMLPNNLLNNALSSNLISNQVPSSQSAAASQPSSNHSQNESHPHQTSSGAHPSNAVYPPNVSFSAPANTSTVSAPTNGSTGTGSS